MFVFRHLPRAFRGRRLVFTGFLWISALSTATAEEIRYPLAIAVHEQTIYLADRDLPGIWRVENGVARVHFQADKKLRTPLNAPRCLAIDGEGRLLAGDSATRDVYRFDDDGQPQPLTNGGIGIPMAIAALASGDLLVTDAELSCIWRVPAGGGMPARLAEVPAPRGIALDSEGRPWVISRGKGKNQLVRISTSGKLKVMVKGDDFQFIHQVVFDSQGAAYVSDGYGKAVWKVEGSDPPVRWATTGAFINPVGLAWLGDNLLVVDPRARGVFQIDPAGTVTPYAIQIAGE